MYAGPPTSNKYTENKNKPYLDKSNSYENIIKISYKINHMF